MMRKSRLSKPYKCGLIFHWSDHSQIKNPAQGRVLLFGRTTQIRTGDLYHVKVAL